MKPNRLLHYKLVYEKEKWIMAKTNHLTFNDIEFIMQMLEKQKASTTDPAERQRIEEIEEKIRKIAF